MTNQRYSAEFRDEAVRQVLDRGYSVKEVSGRLGVSAHSLYKWVKAVKPRPEKRRDEELLFTTSLKRTGRTSRCMGFVYSIMARVRSSPGGEAMCTC